MTTIYEVAAHAGVSPATVSRVLNGNPSVHSELAERVRRSIDVLGYRPSRIARSMRTQRTLTVAVIVPDIENPFFTSAVRGIEEQARARGLMTVLCNSDADPDQEAAYLDLVVDQRLDGVILASSRSSLGEFRRDGVCAVPTVLIDRELDDPDIDMVLVDNVLGARSATTHLIDAGGLRVGCIAGPASATTSRQRLLGYREALEQAGMRPSDSLVYEGDFRVGGGRAGVAALLDSDDPPDALLVCNNQMTLGALQELADRGIGLPEDMLVVGFDDEPWARYWRPAVSTVAQPARDVGSTAMRLLVEHLEGVVERPPRHIRLTPALTVRGTSQRR